MSMSNAYDEMRAVLSQAEDIDRAASEQAGRMATLLMRPGALQRVPHWRLKELKKALRDYDMHTGKWKR